MAHGAPHRPLGQDPGRLDLLGPLHLLDQDLDLHRSNQRWKA